MTITKDTIDGWKKEFGSVFKTVISGVEIYFHPLNRKDYLDIARIASENDEIDTELETVKRCVLNDIDVEILESKSGIIPVISEQIMLRSGYQQVEIEEL